MKFRFLIGFIGTVLFAGGLSAAPTFTRGGGVVLSTAIPYTVDTTTSPYRLYFARTPYEIRSATSTNGAAWFEQAGVRISTGTTPQLESGSFTITGASVLRLTSGGYRMLYSLSSASGWSIVSATSTDGLGWANETTVHFTAASSFVGGPQMIKLPNGDWRLYFLRDPSGGDDLNDREVDTALSSDQGVTWTAASLALASPAESVSVAVRSDQRVRIFLTKPLTGETTSSVVLSALSSNSQGTSFALESGVRLSTGSDVGRLSSNAVFLSTGGVRWRMLYGYNRFSSTFTHTFMAETLTPDPQLLTPSQVVRSNPGGAIVISGEIFDSTPTVKLTRSGEADIPGTSLTRNSDLSLTATFDTQNKTLGMWDLVVTNPDSRQGTLANALFITFLSGSVRLTDNLLRPRTGARTKIEVQIYDAGEVAIDVYTLQGELVHSLYKANTSVGTLVQYWDGTTGDGNVVASGVYFIRATGPKLDENQKVVVIR